MAIAIVGSNSGGDVHDNVTNFTFPGSAITVTSGNNLIVLASMYNSAATDSFAAGDLTKSTGTATIGTVVVDHQRTYNITSNEYQVLGIFRVPITGSGTLTMQLANLPTGNYSIHGYAEVSGIDGTTPLEDSDGNNSTPGVTYPGTSPAVPNMVSAGGAMFIGICAMYDDATNTITRDAEFSEIFESEDGSAHQTGSVIYRIVTTGTTDSVQWTSSSGKSWIAVGAVYKAAAGSSFVPAWSANSNPSIL